MIRKFVKKQQKVWTVVFILAVTMQLSCGNSPDSNCTDESCFQGIEVVVLLDSLDDVDSDEFLLEWNTRKYGGGELVAEDFNLEESYVSFYIDIDETHIEQDMYEVEIEINYAGKTLVPASIYDFDWETTVCKKCDSPKEGQELINAYIEIRASNADQ